MKTKLLFMTVAFMAFGFQAFAQPPANDVFSGAIPITPAAEGSGCASPFYLPFSTDDTTDSGVQGSCRERESYPGRVKTRESTTT